MTRTSAATRTTTLVPPTRVTPRIVVDTPTPAGIAGAISRMIAAGELEAGDRLPTVRELSTQLGISPATVSHGWQALARSGLIVSRGRSGTFVAASHSSHIAVRTSTMARTHGSIERDLSKGAPDPRLLPEIGDALAKIAQRAETTSYHEHPVVSELSDFIRATWPYDPQALTVVDGALDGVARTLAAVARFGDRVIVENPTFPQFLDLIESLGLEAIPVGVDAEGVIPNDLAQALSQRPVAAIMQPRAHNPTGACTTHRRAQRLADLFSNSHDVIIIEDDHSGDAVDAPDVSLGVWCPDNVVHIRSYSKSHGPDLRIAALAGSAPLVESIAATRMLGPGWTPRILQRLLCELLSNDNIIAGVDRARAEYRRRRNALVTALATHGVETVVGEGLNVWIPVDDERHALVHLAANGIQVAPGHPFVVTDDGTDHIRVTISRLADHIDEVAATIAAAAKVAEPEYVNMR